MREVIAIVEGQTELEFVNQVVYPYLLTFGVSIRPVSSGKPTGKGHWGVRSWASARSDMLRYLKQGRVLTTLFDFYGLKNDWPGREEAAKLSWEGRGRTVEQELVRWAERSTDDSFDPRNFLPCIQVHEFETLLFVSPEASALSLVASCIPNGSECDLLRISKDLTKILDDHNGKVEAINDSFETAPSRRITSILPSYDKRAWGCQVVLDVGLSDLRAGCCWLDRWLGKLEALGE